MWIIIYISSMFLIGGIISYIKLGKEFKQEFFIYYISVFAALITTITLTFFIIYLLSIRKLREVKYILGGKHLIFRCNNKTKFYAYKDIIKVEAAPIFISFGSINIKFKDANFNITVKVKDSNLFIKELKEKLDSLGMQNKYNEKKLIMAYRNAGYSNDSWERLQGTLFVLPPTIGVCVVLAFICSFFINELIVTLVVVLLLFLYPILALLFSELYLALKYIYFLNKESFAIKIRDEDMEKNTYRNISLMLFAILVVGIIIYIKSC